MRTISESRLARSISPWARQPMPGEDAQARVGTQAAFTQVKPLGQALEGIEIDKPDALAHIGFTHSPSAQRAGQMDGH